jgi:uncharacterized protein DUF3455
MKNDGTTRQQMSRGVLRSGCMTALGLVFAFVMMPTAHAQTVTPPSVPLGLEVDPPNEAFLLGHGVGTQNYVCQPAASLGRVAWTLFTPEATLFDDQDRQLTTHFFSPNPDEGSVFVRATWQDSQDTSLVWAKGIASATVKPDAIPWVKLEVVGTQDGPTGGNTLSRSTFVQRVNTEGGLAPTTGCDVPTDVGSKAFSPYTADYVFYKQN